MTFTGNRRPIGSARPRTIGGTLRGAVLGVGLVLSILAPESRAEAHSAACTRIQVDSFDHGYLLSSYTVSEPGYVARLHAQIDLNGQDGIWTVPAGELGSTGYTVAYTCFPRPVTDEGRLPTAS